jgi:hypothetical protein
MKMNKTLSVLVIAVVVLASGAAEAGKTPSTVKGIPVGHALDLSVPPNLQESVNVNGIQIWTESIRVDGAFFLKPHFEAVNLRAGDAIVIRSATGKIVETITGRGPKDMGTFWGLSARGEDLFLEFHFTHEYGSRPFHIDKVLVGDVDPLGGSEFMTKETCGSSDYEDVVCYQNDSEKWANVMASVGVITPVGSDPMAGILCSGVNVSENNYILTNHHCIPTQSACLNAEFVFGYHNENCGSGPAATDWQSYRCDDILASSPFSECESAPDSLDFSLTSVIGDPAGTFGHVDVDFNPITDGESVYMVQHALGRPQEITHGSGTDVDADAPILRYYNTLDAEIGSDGAPIFREMNHALVGIHHCGGCNIPDAGNRGTMMSAIYPLIEDYLCADFLDLAAVGIQGLSEVSGNGDTVLDPGESWQVEPLVRNGACNDSALGVVGDVEVNPASTGPVLITNGTASFGDVPPREVMPPQLPVVFEVSSQATCGGEVILDVTNLDATNGGPFPDFHRVLSYTVGELVFQPLLFENFAGGVPGTWQVIHNGSASGPAETWTTDNPGGKSLSLTEPFVIVDSDEAGSGVSQDEELITPVVNCAGYEQVELRFNHDFHWFSGGGDEQGDVDIRSGATGGSWVNVKNFSGGDRSGAVLIDITEYAAGRHDVEIRFHYYGAAFDFWWAVDDIEIAGGNFVCGGDSGLIFRDGFESGNIFEWN